MNRCSSWYGHLHTNMLDNVEGSGIIWNLKLPKSLEASPLHIHQRSTAKAHDPRGPRAGLCVEWVSCLGSCEHSALRTTSNNVAIILAVVVCLVFPSDLAYPSSWLRSCAMCRNIMEHLHLQNKHVKINNDQHKSLCISCTCPAFKPQYGPPVPTFQHWKVHANWSNWRLATTSGRPRRSPRIYNCSATSWTLRRSAGRRDVFDWGWPTHPKKHFSKRPL